MTRSSSAASVAVASLLLVGCITGTGNARALYPGAPRPAGELARLSGPIAAVDGQDVSKYGRSFALLPGCHVVQLAAKTGETSSSGGGGYVTNLPSAVYAFRMRAEHVYEIDVRFDGQGGPTVGQVTVRAWDRDANGGAVEVAAAAGAEIDDCQHWTP
jgi:hypothetical protein